MFEHYREPLVTRRRYYGRILRYGLGAVCLVACTLWLGMAGYHWLEGLPWIDAYVNAAMILGGMGPATELHTAAGKVFAGVYALFSGLVFVVVMGIVFAPVVHRALHRFHLDDDASTS